MLAHKRRGATRRCQRRDGDLQSWLFNARGLGFGDDHGGGVPSASGPDDGMADAGENDWARYSYDGMI